MTSTAGIPGPLPTATLLRLMQLSCPTLPIGAYAYSQGLEYAVECGWVQDEPSARDWITGLLSESVARLDLPVLLRAHRAWSSGDEAAPRRLGQWLLACRECRELQDEERHLGTSLARVLAALGVDRARGWESDADATFVVLFALGATHFGAPERETAAAYCFAWVEHQVSAATRLVPLGQLAAQRILSRGLDSIPGTVDTAAGVDDASIGFFAPAQTMACALHEIQRVRLFRS